MNRKALSPRQLEVMEILWDAGKSMTASEIVNASGKMQINTVQASLRSLVSKKYIEVGQIVYSGTVLSRSYIPTVTREEYLDFSCQKLSEFSSSSLVMASLIGKAKNTDVLDELEAMILKRKKELEEEE